MYLPCLRTFRSIGGCLARSCTRRTRETGHCVYGVEALHVVITLATKRHQSDVRCIGQPTARRPIISFSTRSYAEYNAIITRVCVFKLDCLRSLPRVCQRLPCEFPMLGICALLAYGACIAAAVSTHRKRLVCRSGKLLCTLGAACINDNTMLCTPIESIYVCNTCGYC